eukprot:CAMPEP_0195597400 /NCGR_PEP_ID=MMETSP0815-20121206/2967_1 /TAXON_ID=97485 /ORGANISM="Prymnesium parvum, Strain Texoma1" /LENGTH=50 /DNA_ID=CAMNT_0040736743 /DNA_START=250 /DNA_END=402 /DNA_ORIENTATION=+
MSSDNNSHNSPKGPSAPPQRNVIVEEVVVEDSASAPAQADGTDDVVRVHA